MIPGEVQTGEGDVTLNPGRPEMTIDVTNVGDRPVQVGSHFHFFEVNRELAFNRAAALGYRLAIPAGTAVRFEPGETKSVALVAFAGSARAFGLNGLVNGGVADPAVRAEALRRAAAIGCRMRPWRDGPQAETTP
ncbi:MAG: urease subunit beta [Thermaerobacter sp.]|nr:urease subunit beta [Thermaerobacter sp.]